MREMKEQDHTIEVNHQCFKLKTCQTCIIKIMSELIITPRIMYCKDRIFKQLILIMVKVFLEESSNLNPISQWERKKWCSKTHLKNHLRLQTNTPQLSIDKNLQTEPIPQSDKTQWIIKPLSMKEWMKEHSV
jgi:hypothetical protein